MKKITKINATILLGVGVVLAIADAVLINLNVVDVKIPFGLIHGTLISFGIMAVGAIFWKTKSQNDMSVGNLFFAFLTFKLLGTIAILAAFAFTRGLHKTDALHFMFFYFVHLVLHCWFFVKEVELND